MAKEKCQRLFVSKEVINVDLSFSQYDEAGCGQLLGMIHYGGFLDGLLSREEHYGYPHNGGRHTLSVTLEPGALEALLDLIVDAAQNGAFGSKDVWAPRAMEFARIIREERIPGCRLKTEFFSAPR
jgi:hypothetical protein